MKFFVPNYSCLQNPWLGYYRSQIPVLSVLCPQLNLLNPPEKNSLVRHSKDQYTFSIISRSFLLRVKNISAKACTENQNTHFLFSNIPPPRKSCCLWDNVEKFRRARQAMAIWCTHIACWIPKATHTHTHTQSQYVILIAFPLQQWLHERDSMFRYTSAVLFYLLSDCHSLTNYFMGLIADSISHLIASRSLVFPSSYHDQGQTFSTLSLSTRWPSDSTKYSPQPH